MKRFSFRVLATTLLCAVVLNTPSHAQTASPSVPTPGLIDRTVLPIPDAPFTGKIGKTFEDSTPDYPKLVKAHAAAPNIVVILLDDLGFGQPGTFGGPVPTPALDRLAAEGLRYNQFHTTAICSSTRAALLTGRNHHQVASGTITDLATGYPGYNSIMPRSAATVARVLKENGYNTAMWGKWHNTPPWEVSAVGPFDHWPTGMGFEYFYGFQNGEISQWEPPLFRNTVAVEPPKTAEQGYQLTGDLVDDAIRWMDQQRAVNPDKPYFIYFAPGAVHAPLHAPKEWIDRFRGKFDQGWDKVREETFARQKRLGVIPANTRLTPRPKEIEAWDSLSPNAKRLYARHQEVFAGYLAYADFEIGRLLDAVNRSPRADNTMIIYIAGDNGPSAEGSITGTLNNMMTQSGIPDTVARQIAKIDELGGPLHENHYPVGWAWAGASPFQWMKRVPSHFGGTRNGLVISWPAKIADRGGLRTQFHHVVDMVPTILAAANIPAPTAVDGIAQMPMAGILMQYTFSDPQAPGKRTVQYFEIGGHRGIYKDGWYAASFHGVPWLLTGSVGFKDNVWSLYNLDKDFSQFEDLATVNPEKLAELKTAFDQEAEKFSVFPLDDRFAERFLTPRPSNIAGRTKFRYLPGTVRIPEPNAPLIYQRSHTITAKINIPRGGVEGVIVAHGGSSAGYSLYVKDGKLNYDFNFFGRSTYHVESKGQLPEGNVEVAMRYEQLPFKQLAESTGGTAELFVNGVPVGKGMIENVAPGTFSATETMDIGTDLGASVSAAYRHRAPFAFTGKIVEVTIETSPTQPLK